MGLHAEIKKILRETWAPSAFKPAEVGKITAAMAHYSATITDYLTYYIPLVQSANGRTFTFADLFKHCWSASNHGAKFSVVTMDDRSNVPRRKGATQSIRASAVARSDSNKGLDVAIPYPRDACFYDGGVSYNANDGSGGIIKERIDLRRLHVSRNTAGPDHSNLCNELWTAFAPSIQKVMDTRPEGDKRSFVLDCDKNEALCFVKGQTCDMAVGRPHNLGEGEPALVHWTCEIENTPRSDISVIHWFTTDSDVIDMYFFYHDKRSQAQKTNVRILWHPDENTVVDMAELVECTLAYWKHAANLHLTARDVAEAMILCGTDFRFTAPVSFGFGPPKIMAAYFHTRGNGSSPERFKEWLRRLWGTTEKAAEGAAVAPFLLQPESIESIRAKETKKYMDQLEARTLKLHHATRLLSELTEEGTTLKCKFPRTDEEEHRLHALQHTDVKKAAAAEKRARDSLIFRFPTDDTIEEEAFWWNWNCLYFNEAHTGKRPEVSVYKKKETGVQEDDECMLIEPPKGANENNNKKQSPKRKRREMGGEATTTKTKDKEEQKQFEEEQEEKRQRIQETKLPTSPRASAAATAY